jgi:hypothetical protein
MFPACSEGRQGTARRTGSVLPSTISTSAGWLKIKKQRNIVFFLLIKGTVISILQRQGKRRELQFSLVLCRLSQNEFLYFSHLHNMPVNFALRSVENKLPILLLNDILSVF